MIDQFYPITPQQQLGDGGQVAIAAAGAASTSIAAGGATATALIAAGVSAQAVPVIGTILGAIAIIGGYLLAAKAKAKGIKAQASAVDKANTDLIIQNAELDTMVANSEQTITAINTELTKAGLSGLSGFSDFLKKTFTPVKYQQGILEDKQAINARLTKEAEQKITLLEGYKKQLETLYDKLTGGKNLQRTLLIGGGIAASIAAFYFLNVKYKWFKF